MSSFPRAVKLLCLVALAGLLAACGLIPLPDADVGDPFHLNGQSIGVSDVSGWYSTEPALASAAETSEGELRDRLAQLLTGITTGAVGSDALGRAELEAIMGRLLGVNRNTPAPVAYADIPASHWAYHQLLEKQAEELSRRQNERSMQIIEAQRKAMQAFEDARRATQDPARDLPSWFNPVTIEIDPRDINLPAGHDWITQRVSSFTQPVTVKEITVEPGSAADLPDTLQVHGFTMAVVISTRTADGLTPLMTIRMNSNFEAPAEYRLNGHNRYLPVSNGAGGELRLGSDAALLVKALRGTDRIVAAFDLALLVDVAASDSLEFSSFKLGAGGAVISF
jgi:hypothetical protein